MIKVIYIFGPLNSDPANPCNRFHAKLQHGFSTLLLTSALLRIATCIIFHTYSSKNYIAMNNTVWHVISHVILPCKEVKQIMYNVVRKTKQNGS